MTESYPFEVSSGTTLRLAMLLTEIALITKYSKVTY